MGQRIFELGDARGQRPLELHDAQGSHVKLTLNATTTDQRRRLLAALEPYVMADGVARKGVLPKP